jgi:hypothetical protein
LRLPGLLLNFIYRSKLWARCSQPVRSDCFSERFWAGACLIGAQFVLYGLAPTYYQTITRGTGTGASVAVSRLGSAMGPYLAGQLLGAGATATQVLQSLLPLTGAAAIAALLLMFLPRSDDLAT